MPERSTVGMFSRDHAITGADAWTAAFVVMALGMVLARTIALAVRPAVPAPVSRPRPPEPSPHPDPLENAMSRNPVALAHPTTS